MKDVARRADVSAATVSNVLSGDKPVRPASRERVMKAVDELNYRINPAASYLRTGRSRIVCAVVPSLENPFFPTILAAVEAQCQRDGYELIVASSDNQPEIEAARISALLQWKPAGFIVIPCSGELAIRKQIEDAHVPLVFADRSPDGAPCDFVEIDNVAAGVAAARHLLELGHSRVVVCAPSLQVRNLRERIQGITQVLAEIGAEPVIVETGLGSVLEALPAGVDARLVDGTAIIALMNTTTLQVLAALNRAGRSVPEEISLVGFDDYPWMPVARPSITAIRQPVGEIGRLAWTQLHERIKGAGGDVVHRRLPVELIVRESTAFPPDASNRAAAARPLAEIVPLAGRR
ncbi:LacI family DNA-binding transcriptional regulator [Devosia sp. A449]